MHGHVPARVREARAVLDGYRIRRYDGEYRWLLDKGVPRYDVDTSFAGYLGGAIDFTDQREAEQTLRELSGKLIAAQEEERRRIARDLHDSVGQRMALLSIRLHDLRQRVIASDDVSAILDHLWEDSEVVARELHSLSHRLHSAKLDALGLVGAIASECREMSESGVLGAVLRRRRPAGVERRRSLRLPHRPGGAGNVVKHSRASSAQVTMTGDRDVLVLRFRTAAWDSSPTSVSKVSDSSAFANAFARSAESSRCARRQARARSSKPVCP